MKYRCNFGLARQFAINIEVFYADSIRKYKIEGVAMNFCSKAILRDRKLTCCEQENFLFTYVLERLGFVV